MKRVIAAWITDEFDKVLDAFLKPTRIEELGNDILKFSGKLDDATVAKLKSKFTDVMRKLTATRKAVEAAEKALSDLYKEVIHESKKSPDRRYWFK